MGLLLITQVGCGKQSEDISIMDLDEYKDIDPSAISSINYITLTEAGRNDEMITDKNEILSIYNYLSKIKVGNETTMACDDNTKIYEFKMASGNIKSIEIECEWIVVNNKRYELK